MIDKINPVEKKLEKKRNKISFILTVFIYLLISLVFLLANKFNLKKEEAIVINVTLADRIYKNQMSINKKSSSAKKENIVTDNKIISDEKKAVVEDNRLKEKDIIKEYEKAKADEKKKIEEEFFSKKENVKENKNNSNLDKLLENIDKNKSQDDSVTNSNDNKHNDSVVLGENNLQWEGGRSRKLVYKSNLTIPEEFKKEGLNTSLILRLTVIDSGLITKVTVQQTSGFSLLDYDIANQVKRWKFEEVKDAPQVFAVLPLNIIY